jgi:catechol 2,3-dioxygenase-like lactoylglutathione lyase family enzyme
MAVRSLVWLGVRTERFAEMVAFYRDVLSLEVIRATETAVWFRIGDGNEIHVYARSDQDHDFFGPAPVVGFLVDDFAATRERMIAAGIEFIGEPQREGGAVWNHYRTPDGNVYEIMERR